MLVQRVKEYKQALQLGHQAFAAQDNTAKLLPHIFGSAAYLQDPFAGLRLPLLPQPEPVSAEQSVQQKKTEQQSNNAPASQALPAKQAASMADIDISGNNELQHQPQNFKAMLEAALKGDVCMPPSIHHMPHEQPESDTQPKAMYVGSTDNKMSVHDHIEGHECRTTVPHVLVWLEQGHGLFDGDEVDELEHQPEQS